MLQALTVRGTFRGASGYDHHVREFVREFHRQGLKVHLLDMPSWSPLKLAAKDRDSWFDTLQSPVKSDIALHFCMPPQVKRDRRKLNVNYTMFEATRIPRDWVKQNLKHDLVILPTESSKQAWINSGIPEDRIRLCPLGIHPEVFSPDVKPMFLKDKQGKPLHEYSVRMLNISDLLPRKNLLSVLRVWIQATKSTDDAVLILKLSCGSEKWLNIFFCSMEEMESKLGKTRQDAAPIVWLTNQFYPDLDMPRLHAAATHYWSMSHGEGWDQPMVEAAATGLQLLAPEHSAYTSYLDQSTAYLIPSRQIPVDFRWTDGLHKLFKHAEWWEPDEDTAAEYLQQMIRHPGQMTQLSVRERIIKEFTWEQTTKRLINILDELAASTPYLRRSWKNFFMPLPSNSSLRT